MIQDSAVILPELMLETPEFGVRCVLLNLEYLHTRR